MNFPSNGFCNGDLDFGMLVGIEIPNYKLKMCWKRWSKRGIFNGFTMTSIILIKLIKNVEDVENIRKVTRTKFKSRVRQKLNIFKNVGWGKMWKNWAKKAETLLLNLSKVDWTCFLYLAGKRTLRLSIFGG